MDEATKGARIWRVPFGGLPAAQSLDGIPVPDATVPDDWHEEPPWAARVVDQVASDLAIDTDTAGWHAATPGSGRRLRDPGAVPRSVQRSAWLVRFNPGLFEDSDPYEYFAWDDPVSALQYPLGPEALTRQTVGPMLTTVANYLRDVAVGDLLFIVRTPPSTGDGSKASDPLQLRRVAHLIGVLWVHIKVDMPITGSTSRPNLRYVPLVRFTEPVPIPQARVWMPGLTGVDPLRLPQGFLPLSSGAAIAVTAACSLPLEVLTVEHVGLPHLAAELRKLNTGPVQPLRDYLASATLRYARVREIEGRAVTAVKDIYRDRFAVVDVSGRRRLGYDLAVGHVKTRHLHHEVEVKGTAKSSDATVTVTDHEYAAAEASAAAGNTRWWLYTVTKALHPLPDPPLPRPATSIVPAWKARISNPGAVVANPLRRLDRLPGGAWGSPSL